MIEIVVNPKGSKQASWATGLIPGQVIRIRIVKGPTIIVARDGSSSKILVVEEKQ